MIGLRKVRQNGHLTWGLALILALAVAAIAGIYSVAQPKRALAFAGLLVIGPILLDLSGRKGTLVDQFRWVPWAWMALFLVSDMRFIDTDPLAVTAGAGNVQHAIQLATYAVVTALVVRARRSLLAPYPRPVPKGILLAWPIFAVLSASWSLVPIYSLVRSVQLLVLAALALLVVRIWLSDRTAGKEICARTLRLFVQIVTILAALGLVLAPNLADRFAWPGVHPGVAATYLGAAFVILVLGGRSLTRFPAWTYWPRLLLLGGTIYLAQTRSVLGGIVLAIGVALWFKGREKIAARYLGVTYYLVGGILFTLIAAEQLMGYLSRGEPSQAINTLSGRIPLWEFAISQLDSVREWMLGFGYGASRLVTLSGPQFQWAGSAHSMWMELLLGIGLVGVLLATASIVVLISWLAKRRFFGSLNVIALALLVFFLMTSSISEGLALPGIGFGFLALLHVPALAQRGIQASPESREHERPTAAARG